MNQPGKAGPGYIDRRLRAVLLWPLAVAILAAAAFIFLIAAVGILAVSVHTGSVLLGGVGFWRVLRAQNVSSIGWDSFEEVGRFPPRHLFEPG